MRKNFHGFNRLTGVAMLLAGLFVVNSFASEALAIDLRNYRRARDVKVVNGPDMPASVIVENTEDDPVPVVVQGSSRSLLDVDTCTLTLEAGVEAAEGRCFVAIENNAEVVYQYLNMDVNENQAAGVQWRVSLELASFRGLKTLTFYPTPTVQTTTDPASSSTGLSETIIAGGLGPSPPPKITATRSSTAGSGTVTLLLYLKSDTVPIP